MKKLASVLLVSIMLIVLLYGCSKSVTKVSNDTTVSATETTTECTTEQTTATTTQQDITTTKKITTTSVSTATKKSKTSQSKVKTTKKVTTTQKQTTTKPYYCDEGGNHHRRNVGPIGWYKTYDEAMEARIKYCKEHPNLTHYTIEKCSCGLYTATFKESPTKSTTKPYYCYEGGSHHTDNVGQIGWCSTREEMFDAISNYISSRGLDGKANYTPVKCSCGKYTAYIN